MERVTVGPDVAAPVDEDEALLTAVRRINGKILGLTLGAVLGLVLFVATIWLVLKGGPVVGPHLSLLGQFYPGYRVTVGGSFLGLFYGFLTGWVAGWLVGAVYNAVLGARMRRRATR
jgi:hypothetical protein